MEISLARITVSILLIILGLFYFLKPEKAANIFNAVGLKYSSVYLKYAGLVIIILGLYYILVMLEILPMLFS
jgi:uncharacterized protein YjeT (DUF2065 family)